MVIGWLQQEQEDGAAGGCLRLGAGGSGTKAEAPALPAGAPAGACCTRGRTRRGVLTCFGELPPEITRAIQMHDTGWAASDAQQIQRLRSGGAQAGHASVSFISIPPGEVEEAWTASINTVEAFSKTGAMIVSRHFSLLAGHDPGSPPAFRAGREGAPTKARGQRKAEATEGDDLARWTAALGFCDLVSLYLLSGLSGEVELPLAHPASPQAQTAPRVRMQVDGTQPSLHSSGRARRMLFYPSRRSSIPLPEQGPRAETLTWEVRMNDVIVRGRRHLWAGGSPHRWRKPGCR